MIHENLHSSRDPGLLHAMVEYYLKTRSPACLQILSGIHEARAQVSGFDTERRYLILSLNSLNKLPLEFAKISFCISSKGTF